MWDGGAEVGFDPWRGRGGGVEVSGGHGSTTRG